MYVYMCDMCVHAGSHARPYTLCFETLTNLVQPADQ